MEGAPTVLVVEPQPAILNGIQAMLYSGSYPVKGVSDGVDALDVLAHGPDIGMLLSEADLPDIPGPELARRVRRAYPSTAVMLIRDSLAGADADVPSILKPFEAESRIARVDRVIAEFHRAERRDAELHADWERTREETRRLGSELRIAIRESALNTARSRRRRAGALRPSVLLADDDPVWRCLLSKALARAGVGVVEAANGAEALILCGRRDFDMLITDVSMPRMNGVVLTECVAKEFPDLPVILLTGTKRDLQHSAHPILSKDADLRDLVAEIVRSCTAAG